MVTLHQVNQKGIAPYQLAMYALVHNMENETHTFDVQMDRSPALSHKPAAMKFGHPLTRVFKSGTRCVQMGALMGFSSKFVMCTPLHRPRALLEKVVLELKDEGFLMLG